ncbi:DUF262 domain-containing protein [Elizabethkingia anophelis]|uniref:DUF262 domain-containing protein n=1 Tax=Elizabethkingia anophelis TaxID=1117645 RepID=UPI003891E320
MNNKYKNTINENFQEIFKKCLKIDARTISIKTLLSERNLKRINYSPYYQRNYVWDKTKQSFFIESVILGTEIPPLIFYKSGLKVEVIDGRQRFETLKKFKENDFKLNGRGLMSLEFLKNKSFNTLDDKFREIFWSSNIRVFEFEIINYPELTSELEDKIKKEIFRRYNTGITPLTSIEVDNAKYIDDKLTQEFYSYIENNNDFAKNFYKIFISTDSIEEIPKEELSSFFRRSYTLNRFPISTYAGGSNRVDTLDLLYDFATQEIEDINEELHKYLSQVAKVESIYNELSQMDDKLKSRLIYECILWAIRILDIEEITYEINIQQIAKHYKDNISKYELIEYHYYGSILKRYSDTAEFFGAVNGFDFSLYIRDPNFKQQIKNSLDNREEDDSQIKKFDNLRYNKPAPISTPIEEIITDVETNKYLIRPAYQRQEKISEFKASSIIESILLGINLPPLFIFKRTDTIKEVIDGQQRLLSILGFVGKEYKNEYGKSVLTKKNNFKLKGLKILSDLNGFTYGMLNEDYKEKILDFAIDIIIIDEVLNKNFEATDLFIRLNNKPYPIKENSFEMWNSTVDSEVIQKIKKITNENINWFFVKETEENILERNDRMENEEFITSLSYLTYHCIDRKLGFDKVIGFFQRIDEITCRLKYKTGLTEFLLKLENEAIEKTNFIDSIDKTNEIINGFKKFFNDNNLKDQLNEILNIQNKKGFRRSLQDFYIMWIYLFSFKDYNIINDQKISNIQDLLKEFRNSNGTIINEQFIDNYKTKLHHLYEK